MRRPTFTRSAPTKAQQRSSVRTIAVHRDKPLSDADKVSLSRSYGLPVGEIESIFAEVERERRS